MIFPELGFVVGSQKCELLNWCVLKEKLPNFSFDEETRAGRWWERILCPVFTKHYLQHYWLRNTWSLLSSWSATGHVTRPCVQHLTQSKKCYARFPNCGKNPSQLSNKHDKCFCSESSEKWSNVLLQVIALLIQINFREAKGNLEIVYSGMYKP